MPSFSEKRKKALQANANFLGKQGFVREHKNIEI